MEISTSGKVALVFGILWSVFYVLLFPFYFQMAITSFFLAERAAWAAWFIISLAWASVLSIPAGLIGTWISFSFKAYKTSLVFSFVPFFMMLVAVYGVIRGVS